MSNVDILYKVIALYLLDKSNAPLSNSALCEFFVKGNYTDYFNAASVIGELADSKLITAHSTNNITLYEITESGKDTLFPMLDRIGPEIRDEVENYLTENQVSFRQSRELISDYDRSTFGGFTVHLRALEESMPVIDLQLHVANETIAKSICTNWKLNYEKTHEALMESLIQ